jgi:hypothetical protein
MHPSIQTSGFLETHAFEKPRGLNPFSLETGQGKAFLVITVASSATTQPIQNPA